MTVSKKTFVVGFMCGAVFFSGVSFAASTDLVAKVMNYKVSVNGKAQMLNNKPVAINGTTYLPVRDVAKVTGYSVNFVNGEVQLNNSTGTTTPTTNNPVVSKEVKVVKDLEINYSVNNKLDLNKVKVGIAAGELTVNASDSVTGDTLLILSIKENNFALYSYLKSSGVDPELANKEGQTPLHITVIEKNDFYFGDLLSELNVKTKVKDVYGKMPIDYAEKNSTFQLRLKSYDE